MLAADDHARVQSAEQWNGQNLREYVERDYLGHIDLTNAKTVMSPMALAFKHFNNKYPCSALRMRLSKTSREHRAAQQRFAQLEQRLHCE